MLLGRALKPEGQEKEDSFLDLGCNVGRYLNYLAIKGFTNIYGVDVGKSALQHMNFSQDIEEYTFYASVIYHF